MLLFFEGIISGIKGVLQSNEIFTGLERVKDGLLSFELFGGVFSGFNGQADAAVALVDLDDAGSDFLANFENVLDLVNAFFADLGDVNQSVNVMTLTVIWPPMIMLSPVFRDRTSIIRIRLCR